MLIQIHGKTVIYGNRELLRFNDFLMSSLPYLYECGQTIISCLRYQTRDIFWKNSVHPAMTVPENIYAKKQNCCSWSFLCSNSSLQHFVLVFPLFCHPSLFHITVLRRQECHILSHLSITPFQCHSSVVKLVTHHNFS